MEMIVVRDYLSDDSISSTTASNSDIEEVEEVIQPQSESYQPQNSTQISSNINSIGVQSSSEVHFGNRIVCNGPVTITQNENDFGNKTDEEDLSKNDEKISEKRILLNLNSLKFFILAIIALFTLVVMIFLLNLKSSNTQLPHTANKSNENDYLDMVLRSEWNASPTVKTHDLLSLPVDTLLWDYINMTDCYTKVRKNIFFS